MKNKEKCFICGDVPFNKNRESIYCKRCYKAYSLGYQAGYHSISEKIKQMMLNMGIKEIVKAVVFNETGLEAKNEQKSF